MIVAQATARQRWTYTIRDDPSECAYDIYLYIYIHTVYNTYVVIDIGGAKEAGMID